MGTYTHHKKRCIKCNKNIKIYQKIKAHIVPKGENKILAIQRGDDYNTRSNYAHFLLFLL